MPPALGAIKVRNTFSKSAAILHLESRWSGEILDGFSKTPVAVLCQRLSVFIGSTFEKISQADVFYINRARKGRLLGV
jgi:hypothetical protein